MSKLLGYAARFFLSFFPVGATQGAVKPWKDRRSSLVILGNGPGLNSYLEAVSEPEASADCMCVNLFALNENFEFFKPRHYVVFDPLFFVGLDDENSMASRVFRAINAKLSWDMTLYIPLRFKSHRNSVTKLMPSEHLTIVYFRDAGLPLNGNALSLWLMNQQVIMPRAQNVLVASIYIAMFLGYSEVFLEGADHSWHKYLYLSDDNNLMIKDVHFYDGNPQVKPLLKDPVNRVHFSMEEIFGAYYMLHKSYKTLSKLSKKRGVNVINRTPESFIDAFPKVGRD
ncbi:hypothetical protein KUV44_08385 [Marinobacter daepoensis]|uniref:Uncharacterized protein n=1 Tax=Marinobacter daepoensis TaxID=262077 RepID=A0ABS3BM78_9GAMM|nr:hypothetical protein [Marinobacter daepoensis]MBN7771290.1 hypothetical protein [Marinobacter daepoensis]MBY6079152.1 hypothetical protein [Marinobacter daepoensis]